MYRFGGNRWCCSGRNGATQFDNGKKNHKIKTDKHKHGELVGPHKLPSSREGRIKGPAKAGSRGLIELAQPTSIPERRTSWFQKVVAFGRASLTDSEKEIRDLLVLLRDFMLQGECEMKSLNKTRKSRISCSESVRLARPNAATSWKQIVLLFGRLVSCANSIKPRDPAFAGPLIRPSRLLGS